MLKILFRFLSDDKKIKKILHQDSDDYNEVVELFFSIKDLKKRKMIINEMFPHEIELMMACIEDDDKKIELLQLVDFFDTKKIVLIIRNINDDDKKIKLMLTTEGIKTEEKASIIESINDDDKKIKLMLTTEGIKTREKASIIESINDDDKKIKLMLTTESLLPSDKAYIIKKIKDEKKRITLMLSTEDLLSEHKTMIINSIQNEKNRIRLMQITPGLSSSNKKNIMRRLYDSNKIKEALQTATKLTLSEKAGLIAYTNDDKLKIEFIQTTENLEPRDKARIIDSIVDENKKIELIRSATEIEPRYLASIIGSLSLRKIRALMYSDNLSSDIWNEYRRKYADTDFVNKNLEFFLQNAISSIEDVDFAKATLSRMSKKNNEVVKGLDFRLLEQKYIEKLGEERINLISCYPDIQEKIINLSNKQLSIFTKCIDFYVEKNKTDEWTLFASKLLKYISEYNLLIESLKDIENLNEEDISNITIIMQSENWCEIRSIEETRNYNEIITRKCQEIMQDENATLDQKKQAVYQKIFGHSTAYAKAMIEKFGEDIENIDDSEMKDYIRTLKIIDTIESVDLLQEIFDECDFAELDKVTAERKLKTEYGKKYFGDLYVPQEKDRVDKTSNIYEAGTEFKIILTSLAAYNGGEKKNNYKSDWNMPVINTQHFCTSYIRNDMIGTAPIHSICYGFIQMKDDALMLSGACDIYSSSMSFESTAAHNEKYYTPNVLIDKTEGYNEMDFRRIQGGVKIQPDYIVVFRRNGKIKNMKEAKRASRQWNGMPIVIVDIDKCLESEMAKVNNMITEYDQNPSVELAKEIVQKVRNNRQTDRTFCITLESKLNQLRKKIEDDMSKKMKVTVVKNETVVSEEELIENDRAISAKEREKGKSRIKKIYNKVREAITEEPYQEK